MLQFMEDIAKSLTKDWWLFILYGVFAILFGILIVAWPSLGVFTLVVLFGAFALADGILSIIAAFTVKDRRAWRIFRGIVGIVAGVVALAWPDITAVALLAVIAAWAFVMGIVELVFAIATPTSAGNRFLLALGGVFSIVFGIFLVARPGLGALAVVWIIGLFAVLYGIYSIVFGVNLKDLKDKIPVK
jgi:uncharacterized membrane protein HdeD (DUF308 family)